MLGDRALLLGDGSLTLDSAVKRVLESGSLQDVYGIPFERLFDSSGNLRVFPRME